MLTKAACFDICSGCHRCRCCKLLSWSLFVPSMLFRFRVVVVVVCYFCCCFCSILCQFASTHYLSLWEIPVLRPSEKERKKTERRWDLRFTVIGRRVVTSENKFLEFLINFSSIIEYQDSGKSEFDWNRESVNSTDEFAEDFSSSLEGAILKMLSYSFHHNKWKRIKTTTKAIKRKEKTFSKVTLTRPYQGSIIELSAIHQPTSWN